MEVQKLRQEVKLLVDFGNSETRAVIIDSKSNKPILTDTGSEIHTYRNTYAELPAGYRVDRSYLNGDTTLFLIDGVCMVNGELVDIEFSKEAYKPAGFTGKSNQPTTLYTLNLLLIKAIEKLSNIRGIDPQDVEWSFKVAVLLPPFEEGEHSADMKNLIKGIKSVVMLVEDEQAEEVGFKEVNIPVQFETIKVQPEGIIAYTTAITQVKDGKLIYIEENKKFLTGYVMVIDIGAGTTDFALINNMRYVNQSKETISTGGNFVAAECSRAIKAKYSISVEPSSMQRVMESGEVIQGNEKIDVTDILTTAKKKYAKTLVYELKNNYFVRNIPISNIKGILLVGGGTLPAIRDGKEVSPPMSKAILEEFKQYCPSVELLSLHSVNPREANIVGLQIMSKLQGMM